MGKGVSSGQGDWLCVRGRMSYLEAEDFGLDEGEGFAVYFDDAFAGLGDVC